MKGFPFEDEYDEMMNILVTSQERQAAVPKEGNLNGFPTKRADGDVKHPMGTVEQAEATRTLTPIPLRPFPSTTDYHDTDYHDIGTDPEDGPPDMAGYSEVEEFDDAKSDVTRLYTVRKRKKKKTYVLCGVCVRYR